MSCRHLSPAERYCIEIELKKKVSHNQIAKAAGRSRSTVSREIRRNTGLSYRHKQVDRFARERHSVKAKAIKMTEEMKYIVAVCLKKDRSPEQIAGRFQYEGLISLHRETVYQYTLTDKAEGGFLYRHLRRHEETYRKLTDPLIAASVFPIEKILTNVRSRPTTDRRPGSRYNHRKKS